jgi:hypothetical protein
MQSHADALIGDKQAQSQTALNLTNMFRLQQLEWLVRTHKQHSTRAIARLTGQLKSKKRSLLAAACLYALVS